LEDGVLISDEFTNPHKRRAMMEKRQRKVGGIEAAVPPPELTGPADADVTLIGWGSTDGVIQEAREILEEEGITANQLQIRWMVPLHGDATVRILENSRRTILIENNYSGQFARYLRNETSFVPDGYIRKYDGEPFMPHHIVEAVKEQLAGAVTCRSQCTKSRSKRRQHGNNRALFKQITLPDLKGKVDPDWCPGCGDFGVLAAFQKALVDLQIQPHNVVTISGIGCSSNLPGYVSTYGMHTLHGRALAVATGVKLANHELTVAVTGGDGDGFGIGGNHFIHTMRRNVDLLYLAMDNQIYGLTTGQTSPTSQLGMKTKSAPYGNVEPPINPIALAIAAGATFVARGFSGEQRHLTEPIKQGLQHRASPFIDVWSCDLIRHLPLVQAAGKEAGRRRLIRLLELGDGDGKVAVVGRRDSDR
jgi:2-oxoglutarate ferredoxin oxidoreductase subunit beta